MGRARDVLASLPFADALRRIRSFCWSDVDWLVTEMPLAEFSPPAAVLDAQIELVEPQSPFEEIVAIDPDIRERARKYLDAGYKALLCRSDGTTKGYIFWHGFDIARPHPNLERIGLTLEEGDIYSFNLYIAPEHRAGGVAGAFFARTLFELRDRGVKRAFGIVSYKNTASRWMHVVHGWKFPHRFRGKMILRCFLVSNRGVLFNSSVLGLLMPWRRQVVSDFVPFAGRPPGRAV